MTEVTKAIIVAAGLGSRMYPFTKVDSKLLIPIINKPIIEYLIEELSSSGIKEIVIVSNHLDKVKELLEKDERLENLLKKLKKNKSIERLHHAEYKGKIDLIRQNKPMGWMHEVLHAKEYVKDAPFLVCFSDVIYTSEIPAAKQIITKFQETNKNIRASARFLFKPDVFQIVEKEQYPLGEDVADLDVFDKLRERNELQDLTLQGGFHHVGDPLSYLKTQTIFGLDDPEIGREYKEFLKEQLKEKE